MIGHAKTRVQGWLNPWPHANTSGYQIIQGWFAIAAGGLFGEGPGQSNASHIPEASTDLIFAVIADELGLVGASALLFGYLLMVGTGLRVAIRCDRAFEKLLATGLSLILGVQTFVIVGGVTRLIPLTGITLPFVSYGGSSLIANYILLALLLRISHDTETPPLLRDDAAEAVIGGRGMNRQIRLVGVGIMVLFVALFLQLNWLQIVHAHGLEANPLNGRAVVKEYTAKRGDIVSADGVTLATSVPTNDQFKYLRQYPTGALFEQVTGFFSFTYGSDGAERTYDKVLTGAAARSSCRPA